MGFITPLATGQVIGNNPELVIIFGFIIIIAVGICYVMLLLASAVGYITLFFTPLAWSVSPKAGRKMLEVTIFILFTPFFITCSLAIATSLMTSSLYAGAAALGQILIGIALLFVSAFSPFILFKVLPLTHAASLTGAHEAVKHVGRSAKSHASKAGSLVTGSPKSGSPSFKKDNFRKDAALGGLGVAAAGTVAGAGAAGGAGGAGGASGAGSHNSKPTPGGGAGGTKTAGAPAGGASGANASGANASGAGSHNSNARPGGDDDGSSLAHTPTGWKPRTDSVSTSTDKGSQTPKHINMEKFNVEGEEYGIS